MNLLQFEKFFRKHFQNLTKFNRWSLALILVHRLIVNMSHLCKLRHRKKVLKIFENSFRKNVILKF